MASAKKRRPKSAMESAGYCADYRSRFGVNITPATSSALRCRLCGSFLVLARKEVFLCERSLCGPIIPESVVIDRIQANAGYKSRAAAAVFLADHLERIDATKR